MGALFIANPGKIKLFMPQSRDEMKIIKTQGPIVYKTQGPIIEMMILLIGDTSGTS